MKLYLVSWDANAVVVLARNEEHLASVLGGEDDRFVMVDGHLKYYWDESIDDEECDVFEVDQSESQVVQWTLH